MSWGAVSNAVSALTGYTSSLHGQISSLQGSGNLTPRPGGSHSTNGESPLETYMWSAMGGIPVTGTYVTIGRIITGQPTNPLFAAGTTVMSGLLLSAIAPTTSKHLAEYYAYQILRGMGFRLSAKQMAKPGPVWAVPLWAYVAAGAGIMWFTHKQFEKSGGYEGDPSHPLTDPRFRN